MGTIPPETLVGQLTDITEVQANKVARALTDEYEGVIVFSVKPIRGTGAFSLEAVSERFDRPQIMQLLPEIRAIVEDMVG